MAVYSSKDIGFLLVNCADVANVSSKLEVAVTDPVQDTTPFGASSGRLEKPGIKHFEITGHEGWYDDTPGSIDYAMTTGFVNEGLMFAYQGNVKGKSCICSGGAVKVGYKRIFSVGDFTKAQMELGVNGIIDDAKIVAPLAVYAGDGNTEADYLDLGAAGFPAAAGCTIYTACTVLVLSGRPDLTLTFEDSSDHITFVDQTVMTPFSYINTGCQMKASTDLTVNRYVAAKHAFGGAGGTPTATWVMAVKVN